MLVPALIAFVFMLWGAWYTGVKHAPFSKAKAQHPQQLWNSDKSPSHLPTRISSDMSADRKLACDRVLLRTASSLYDCTCPAMNKSAGAAGNFIADRKLVYLPFRR